MEKWKIFVIVFLLGGALAYPAYQARLADEATKLAMRQQAENARLDAQKPQGPSANVLIQKFVGKPLPAWNIAPKYWMNTGAALNPSDLKGHVAVVEFFRIKCSHCQQAAPVMRNLHETFGAKGLKMIGIQSPGDDAQENDWDNVASVVKTQFGLDYPIAFDEKSQLFKGVYEGKVYPSVFILNRAGIVVFAQTGFDDKREAKFLAALQKEMNKN